jgi:glycosyltransferase involved in cell wall biosynthesis
MRETLAARRRGFPPYWAARDRGRDVPDVILAQDARERAHALAADVVVAPSRAVRDRTAGRWGLDPARVRVVPHPFTPDPALLSIPPGRTAGAPPVVTFLGRLEPNKGVIDLALALRTVAARMPGARFRLVGGGYDGGALGDVRRYVRDCMLHHLGDGVEIPGPVPPQEVPAVLAATDVVVIPSIWDNFPYTCLEAMAAARAVVATDSGGMREMLDDGCGWLVPPRDPGALAAALLAVLADPGARAAAGARARRRLLGAYAADVVAGDWEEAYAAAIARRRAPDRERAA